MRRCSITLGAGRHRRDRDRHRITQHLRRQVGDRARHRRRKHQRLASRRKLGDDFPDVVNEAHVEHAIGLVEHETFDISEPERVASDQIEETARRGDQHVNAAKQGANLAAYWHTAYRQRRPDAQMSAIGAKAVEDLAREFAGRAEHQHPATLAQCRSLLRGEAMQDRQRECRGLAGSGLGDPDHVVARHDRRYGLDLDRSWSEVFFFGKRPRDCVVKSEVVK